MHPQNRKIKDIPIEEGEKGEKKQLKKNSLTMQESDQCHLLASIYGSASDHSAIETDLLTVAQKVTSYLKLFAQGLRITVTQFELEIFQVM